MKKVRAWLRDEAAQNLKDLAVKYSLEVTKNPEGQELVLTTEDDRLGFMQKRGFHFVTSDFAKLRPLMASQPFAKALGRNKKLKVLDCTAGWGMDSALMAKSGFEVLAFEKNFLLFEIL